MNIHRAQRVADRWEEVRAELERAFVMARDAARDGESFVFVVHHDDLLGRRRAGDAMVAAGLLSAARTAALEGMRQGWTANVIAYEDDSDPDLVTGWAEHVADDSHGVTGELIRLGPAHLGKALP